MTKNKPVHAVLIDPAAQTITDVVLDGNNILDALYNALGCGLVEVVHVDRHHDLVVDEEGLFKNGQKYFAYGQRRLDGAGFDGTSPLAGRAMLVGLGRDGYFTSARVRAEQVKDRVYFLPDEHVRRFRDAGGFDSRISTLGADLKPTGPVDVIPVRPALAAKVAQADADHFSAQTRSKQ